ncbi:MAG: PP2C family serine/threonine-protein phosphatase [Dehalococcoidia bacterium]
MWRFAAARAIGTSHLRANLPCQDRFLSEVLENGSLVAALADGAGSAALAERGAEIAVAAVLAHVKQSLEERRTDFAVVLREAAASAREAISAEADREGTALRSYASTLLAVVLSPEGGGALQLGDGVIVVSDGGDEWSWVFWPQRGEYANTTHFLTDEDALDQLEAEVFSAGITDLALMSDGLEPLALHYASKTVHDPFFNGMFPSLVKAEGCAEIYALSAFLEQFLSSERVGSRTDDDVSLILATRRNHELSL